MPIRRSFIWSPGWHYQLLLRCKWCPSKNTRPRKPRNNHLASRIASRQFLLMPTYLTSTKEAGSERNDGEIYLDVARGRQDRTKRYAIKSILSRSTDFRGYSSSFLLVSRSTHHRRRGILIVLACLHYRCRDMYRQTYVTVLSSLDHQNM